MKIKELLAKGEPTLSFEVFPPKTEDKLESVEAAALEIAGLHPAFMSVTYGAGGGTSRYTVDIASSIMNHGVTPLAHLTCVSSTREKVHGVLEELKERGIENVLALRGDIPADGKVEKDYRYASQLIAEIKAAGDFCIGAACYPEGHVESVNKTADIQHLKEKVEAEIEKLLDTLTGANATLLAYANKKIEELDTRRQTISKAIAELSVETISPQQIKKLSYYLDNWDSIDFDDKRKAADGLISTIKATSDRVQIEWKI